MVVNFAHRGSLTEPPKNTLSAIKKAIDHQVKAIELDVQNCGFNISSVHPHASYTDKKLIDEFHELGYKVYPYFVNDEKHYKQLINLGVDGVFSNNPSIFSGVS